MSNTIGKRELSARIKQEVATLVEAFDLDQMLGSELYEQICDNDELCGHAEKRRDQIADRIRKM